MVEVLFEVKGRAGFITLNRPQALNALTLGMAQAMTETLRAWAHDGRVRRVVIRGAGERAFCAGGDIRALYEWGRACDPSYLDFFRTEYRLNALIKRWPKPYLALIDGTVMGGGVGVSVHGTYRVASERLTFAMPETGIGFFPDVGGTYFLPRLPGEIGMYLGLTGVRLGAADALYAGIATRHVPSAGLSELAERLCSTDDLEDALDRFAADPGPALLQSQRAAIDRHFGHGSIEAILNSLDGDASEWAQKTAAVLRQKSPTSLKITFRQLRLGATLEFEEAMRLEYRFVNRILEAPDFFEGIRAAVVDKDQKPQWRPDRLEDVSDADIAAYFAPLAEELSFEPVR